MIILLVLLLTQVVAPGQAQSAHASKWARMQILRDALNGLDSQTSIESINDLFDFALTQSRLLLAHLKLDPITVPPPPEQSFYAKITLASHPKERCWMWISEGSASGVSGIYRNGDAKINYDKRMLTLSVPLQIRRVAFSHNYDGRVKYVYPTGHIDATCDVIQISCRITLDLSTLLADMQQFDIVIRNRAQVSMSMSKHIYKVSKDHEAAFADRARDLLEVMTMSIINVTAQTALQFAISALNGAARKITAHFENFNASDVVYQGIQNAFEEVNKLTQ